jgi:hypothetical protein
VVQSPGGTFKNKYETSDSSGPTLKRRRSGATIEAAEETPGSATNSSGEWQQERFEDLKIKLAQALHRISALETCIITYVVSLRPLSVLLNHREISWLLSFQHLGLRVFQAHLRCRKRLNGTRCCGPGNKQKLRIPLLRFLSIIFEHKYVASIF